MPFNLAHLQGLGHWFHWEWQLCVGPCGYIEMQVYFKTNNLPFSGHLLNYALDPYVIHPTEAYFPGGGCSGFLIL